MRKYPLFLRFFEKTPQNLGGIFGGEGGILVQDNSKIDPPNFAIFRKFSEIFGKFWDFSERGDFGTDPPEIPFSGFLVMS